MPREVDIANDEFIDAVLNEHDAADEPQQPIASTYRGNGHSIPFDMQGFLARHGLRVKDIKQGSFGTKYILEECPFDLSHKAPDSFIAVMPSGAMCFKCSHDSCASYKWRELRERLEPGFRNRAFQQPQNGQQYQGSPADAPPLPMAPTFREMALTFTQLRPAVVHGLLREGETANLIAATKVGKSWLALSLALCVITGKKWLGTFGCNPGKVLIIDNELHAETITHRVHKVAEALGIAHDEFADDLRIEALRGKLRDVNGLGEILLGYDPGQLRLVVVDAFYRCLPRGADENKNADVAAIYNTIDGYADRLHCAFASVHHASKGTQAGKAVTDVGSGAGSFSRAADCHFVLRPHTQKNVAVVEAAVRSWPPLEPLALRWSFPLWEPDESIDPGAAVAVAKRAERSGVPFDPAKPSKFQVTVAAIEAAIEEHGPLTKRKVQGLVSAGVQTVKDAIDLLLENGRIEEIEMEMHNGKQSAYRIPKPGSALNCSEQSIEQSP